MVAHRTADASGPALGDVVRVLNRATPAIKRWNGSAAPFGGWPPKGSSKTPCSTEPGRSRGDDRLIRLVAGREAMREPTPRGGTRWHPSSVKNLLAQAERLGLAGTDPGHVGPDVWR